MAPGIADMRLDDPMGPEFSARIMNGCAQHNITTVGELAKAIESGVVESHWKGLGSKSIKEIKEYLIQAGKPIEDLFEDPEYRRYMLEDRLTTIYSLLHDVQQTLLRVALSGRITAESRRHVAFKLRDAANYTEQLPTFKD